MSGGTREPKGTRRSLKIEQQEISTKQTQKCEVKLEQFKSKKLKQSNENNYLDYQPSFEAPNARILLVDDNEMNRHVFVGLLKETKIKIDQADSGKICLEKIKETAYDIIFMDHMMPGLDGIETFHIMKEMDDFPSKDSPVVILTANALVGAKEKYLAEGFTDFLAKPIDFTKLEAMIAKLLDPSLLQEVDTSLHVSAPVIRKDTSLPEHPFVDGLDWNYADIHFTSKQMLTDTLRFFADSLEYEAAGLEQLFHTILTETPDYKEYRVKVHGMKNSAATVGIVPLAGMAKMLEDAARAENKETLLSLTPVFLTYWRSYKEKLVPLFSAVPSADTKTTALEHVDEIDALFAQVRHAAAAMDIDELDRLWKCLDSYSYEEPLQTKIDEIHHAIIAFDIDFLQGI